MGSHLGGIREVTRDTTTVTDLLDRLQQALDDADRVRASALATGRGDLAIKAVAATARLVETLTSRLGIDDLEIAKLIADSDLLVRALARATRKDPAIGRAVARELNDITDDSKMPDALNALATATEQKQIQK